VIVVDTNVFCIDLLFTRDAHYNTNRKFLALLRTRGGGATTLVNLLELAGILSFNLNEAQLAGMLSRFSSEYKVAILPRYDSGSASIDVAVRAVLDKIVRKCSFGDALVLALAEKLAPGGSTLVSWDARHFKGKTSLDVLTPAEALAKWGK